MIRLAQIAPQLLDFRFDGLARGDELGITAAHGRIVG
jgi:hypothetical protein